jgi:hypothetical protein
MTNDRPASWRMPTPKQMEKLASQPDRAPPESEPAPDASPPDAGGMPSCRTRAPPGNRGCRFNSAAYPRFHGTCSGSNAHVALALSRFRRWTRFDSTDRMPFGKMSGIACLMTVVSTGPGDMRRTAAGRIGWVRALDALSWHRAAFPLPRLPTARAFRWCRC